jgi:uncharacterized protein YdaU (DUF1376 family)
MSEENKTRKAPAFQFYADDFLAGTSEMSAEEVGGYIRLLCHQWTKGGIPNDEERVARIAGMIGSPSVGYVMAKFRLCDGHTLKNERLEKVREEQQAFKARQSTAGTNGAAKRWKKWPDDVDPNGVAIATPMAAPWPEHSQTIAGPMAGAWPEDSSPSPSPREDTKKEKALNTDLEAFRLRVGAMIRRRPTTQWSTKEMKALKEVFDFNTPESDLVLLEQRYQSNDKYLRRELMTLLNHWNGEIDKTRSTSPSGNNGTGAYSANISDWQ